MIAFTTPADAPRWKRWLVYSPLARIVIFSLLMAASIWLLSIGFEALGWQGTAAPVVARRITFFVMQMLPALGTYLFLVHMIERRRPAELAWNKVVPHGLLGVTGGVLLICSVVAVLWAAGAYQVTGTNPQVDWIKPLFLMGLGSGVAEELVFRGVIFRISEEGLGTWPALLISALLFGGGHAFSHGATLGSSVAIAIEAGLLLGLLYHVSRSLPRCIGLHTAWNFTLGAIFGVPVSGSDNKGWLVSTRPGPDWLTGGGFGAEASVVTVALCSAVTAALLVHAWRRGTFVVRSQVRRRIMETPSSQGV